MSGRQTDTEVLAAQEARRRACAERGDLPGVARAVMDAACRNGSLTGPGAQAMDWLRGLPDGDRMELARIWARWHADPEPEREGDIALRDVSYFRAELLVVASGVARGLDPGLLADARRARLAWIAGEYALQGHREWELADAEIAAGRPPGPAVLAAFRRTALDQPGEPALRETLARFPGPVLNPGEPWADQALDDAARAGRPLERLLAHRASPSAAGPSAAWLRTARDLLAAAGPEQVRRYVPRWFDLVGRERSVPLAGGYGSHDCDPYNAQALRAQAWFLSLLPPSEETCDVLAGLVRTVHLGLPALTRRPAGVAEAAVTALSRTGGDAARRELDDLRRRIADRHLRRRIDHALAATA
ncbi:hypothetical protein ACWGRF_05830 [Streptomyces zhihengii]|uniref:hypothetical protein n=1 Tax=Streptomyces zhihengii TaxID=1818004 RepID=UPI0034557057